MAVPLVGDAGRFRLSFGFDVRMWQLALSYGRGKKGSTFGGERGEPSPPGEVRYGAPKQVYGTTCFSFKVLQVLSSHSILVVGENTNNGVRSASFFFSFNS